MILQIHLKRSYEFDKTSSCHPESTQRSNMNEFQAGHLIGDLLWRANECRRCGLPDRQHKLVRLKLDDELVRELDVQLVDADPSEGHVNSVVAVAHDGVL